LETYAAHLLDLCSDIVGYRSAMPSCGFRAECLDYLFEMAAMMKQLHMDPLSAPVYPTCAYMSQEHLDEIKEHSQSNGTRGKA